MKALRASPLSLPTVRSNAVRRSKITTGVLIEDSPPTPPPQLLAHFLLFLATHLVRDLSVVPPIDADEIEFPPVLTGEAREGVSAVASDALDAPWEDPLHERERLLRPGHVADVERDEK